MTRLPPFPEPEELRPRFSSPSETPRGERQPETPLQPAALLIPTDSFENGDNAIDITITSPRLDDSSRGEIREPQARGTSPGPRQRRFEFDAKVIRDSIVRKFRSVGRDDIADPIDQCHRDAVYKRCVGCRHVKTFYNRCERFYCPICAARLARDRRETVAWWSKVVNQPKHVVLTVRSVEKLTKAYVRQLKADFRKLRSQTWAKKGEFQWRATAITPHAAQREPIAGLKRHRGKLSVWSGRRLGTKSTAWRGGFWSLDVTHSRAYEAGEVRTVGKRTWTVTEATKGGWHVHFHAIVDADFIDKDKLEAEWCKLRGQDMAVIWVEDVRGKDYTAEACKYVCDGIQLGNWPAEKLAEFADALSEERCFDTFGALYKQRAEWTKVKEEIHADRTVCACGCSQWEFFDSNEWEAEGCKAPRPPPEAPRRTAPPEHPVLFSFGFKQPK